MAKYLIECAPHVNATINADTRAHALASAQAIACALQRDVALYETFSATPREMVPPSAADTAFTHVGLGVTAA